MVMWHLRSKRKPTSGRLRRLRKKRKMDRGSEFLEIRIGSEKKKQVRTRGDLRKTRLMAQFIGKKLPKLKTIGLPGGLSSERPKAKHSGQP